MGHRPGCWARWSASSSCSMLGAPSVRPPALRWILQWTLVAAPGVAKGSWPSMSLVAGEGGDRQVDARLVARVGDQAGLPAAEPTDAIDRRAVALADVAAAARRLMRRPTASEC